MKLPSTTQANHRALTGFLMGSYCGRPTSLFAARRHEETDMGIPAKEVIEQRG